MSKQFNTPSSKSKAAFSSISGACTHELYLGMSLAIPITIFRQKYRSLRAKGRIQSHQAEAITCLCGGDAKEKNALTTGTSILTIGTKPGQVWYVHIVFLLNKGVSDVSQGSVHTTLVGWFLPSTPALNSAMNLTLISHSKLCLSHFLLIFSLHS